MHTYEQGTRDTPPPTASSDRLRNEDIWFCEPEFEDDIIANASSVECTQPVQSSVTGLCSACDGINIRKLQDNVGYLHVDNVWDLPRSAKSCKGCTVLMRAVLGKQQPEIVHRDFIAVLENKGVRFEEKLPLLLTHRGPNLLLEVLNKADSSHGESVVQSLDNKFKETTRR